MSWKIDPSYPGGQAAENSQKRELYVCALCCVEESRSEVCQKFASARQHAPIDLPSKFRPTRSLPKKCLNSAYQIYKIVPCTAYKS